MSAIQQAMLMRAGAITDQNRSSLSLLLDPQTADGSGSTTFTDYSPLAKTVTALGGAQVDTSSYKFSGASVRLSGAGSDGLRVPNGGAYDFGSGNFSIQFWASADISNANNYRVLVGITGNGTQRSLLLYQPGAASTNAIYLLASTDGTNWNTFTGTGSGTSVISSWAGTGGYDFYEVARNGSNWGAWKNGTSVWTGTSSATLYSGGTNIYIGCDAAGSGLVLGNIDSIRIYKGACPNTIGSNYTAPTAAFPRT